MPVDYVNVDSTPLLKPDLDPTGVELLWGDPVEVLSTSATHATVKSGRYFAPGLVKTAHLGGQPLLEFYFIDVGQGDGVLIRTPDGRHVLIDGGFPRKNQPTGKNAADFVDWKFVKDYGRTKIELDALVASHNDADHYGGLWDLLSTDPAAVGERDATGVTVEAAYHAGLSWWKDGSDKTLGNVETTPAGKMFTELLNDRASVEAALGGGAGPQLAGEWASFWKAVVATRTSSGTPTPIQRLSRDTGHLPGFAPAPGKVAIKVLAPVLKQASGKPALKYFTGGVGKNTNGHSVLFRVDFDRVRVLLTGDLNASAQLALMADYAGSMQEFECDVAKACHHGSEDVSYRFLQAMRPAVTVISSGDNEGHDHPRPAIVAASATSGFLEIDGDELVSPLIYSTELARSLKLARATRLEIPSGGAEPQKVTGAKLDASEVFLPKKSGSSKEPSKTFDRARIVSDIVYGLVNVRTDGQKILCATRNEADLSWQIKTVRSRF